MLHPDKGFTEWIPGFDFIIDFIGFSKPRWQRVIIAFAGPLFNGILSVVLLVGLFMTHYERPTFWTEPPVIGYVEDDSAAKRVGVLSGDEVVSFDGELTPDWDTLRRAEATAALKTVDIEVCRDGRVERMTLDIGAGMHGIGVAGWHEAAPVRLGRSQPGDSSSSSLADAPSAPDPAGPSAPSTGTPSS